METLCLRPCVSRDFHLHSPTTSNLNPRNSLFQCINRRCSQKVSAQLRSSSADFSGAFSGGSLSGELSGQKLWSAVAACRRHPTSDAFRGVVTMVLVP